MTCFLEQSTDRHLVTLCYLSLELRDATSVDLVTICYLDTEVPGTPRDA